MLGLDAFMLNDQLVDFEVVPRLKLDDGTTWEFDEVTETDGMHFIHITRGNAERSGMVKLLVALFPEKFEKSLDLGNSQGYAELIELRNKAVQDVKIMAFAATLPKCAQDKMHDGDAEWTAKVLKRKSISAPDRYVEVDIGGRSVRFLAPRRKCDDLWMQATSLNINTLMDFIIENDFNDKSTRKYNKGAGGVYFKEDKYFVFVNEEGESKKKKKTFRSFDDAARALANGDDAATSFPCAERAVAADDDGIKM